jgi:hypothetical protein
MSDVMDEIPRVVHPEDVKSRTIHVSGRDLHFVCGVSAYEGVESFVLKPILRSDFVMYPEDVLGAQVQSASIMWERVEGLFQSVRELMTRSGNARSGSFSMIIWTSALMIFF